MQNPLQQTSSMTRVRQAWATTKRQLKSGELDLPGAHIVGFPSTVRAMEVVGLAVVGRGVRGQGGHAGKLALAVCREAQLSHFTYAQHVSAERWASIQALLDEAMATRVSESLSAAS